MNVEIFIFVNDDVHVHEHRFTSRNVVERHNYVDLARDDVSELKQFYFP